MFAEAYYLKLHHCMDISITYDAVKGKKMVRRGKATTKAKKLHLKKLRRM